MTGSPGRELPPWGRVGGLALFAGGLVYSLSATSRPSIEEMAERLSPVTSSPDPGASAEIATVEPRTAPEEGAREAHTVREVMEEFWGAEWAVVEQRLLAEGIDLEEAHALEPWEEIEAKIAQRILPPEEHWKGALESGLKWPDPLTVEWIQHHFGTQRELDGIDLGEIEAIASPYNERILDALERHRQGIELALRHKWLLGQYRRSPRTTKALPQDTRRAFLSAGTAGGGWAVTMSLYAEDHPDLLQIEREFVEERGARDAAIKAWLRRRN